MYLEKLMLPIYTKVLEKSVMRGKKPSHIMVVTDSISSNAKKFVEWCRHFGIKEVTFCLSDCSDCSNRLFEKAACRLKVSGVKINVVTLSGRKEIVLAVRELVNLIEKGEISPDDVDEELFENFLEVKESPDLIIRASETIPDFLIWQSIYSELYFADLDWEKFRYVDFLRCLREYQRRERRYGR